MLYGFPGVDPTERPAEQSSCELSWGLERQGARGRRHGKVQRRLDLSLSLSAPGEYSTSSIPAESVLSLTRNVWISLEKTIVLIWKLHRKPDGLHLCLIDISTSYSAYVAT